MKERRMTMKQSWFCFKHLSFSSTYLQSTGKNTIQKQPPELFIKEMFLKISQNSEKNTSARASFLIKLQASGQQLY